MRTPDENADLVALSAIAGDWPKCHCGMPATVLIALGRFEGTSHLCDLHKNNHFEQRPLAHSGLARRFNELLRGKREVGQNWDEIQQRWV